MSLFHSMNLFTKRRSSFVAGLAIALLAAVSFGGFAAQHVSAYAQDCDNNSIIKCGYSDPANFIAHVTANDSLNGHHDLQSVYSAYGLPSSEYNRFATTARPGVAYKDGRIVVDGQVVATGGASIGREAARQGPGYFTTQQINGVSYYGNTNANAFANDALPIYAIFNAQGVLQFSVLQGCGNPEFGNNVKPTYSCDMLNKTAVAGQANTYNFTTNASAGNNASVAGCVYDYGDGSAKSALVPCTQAMPHTFPSTQTATYTTKVTVYVNLPGKQQATIAPAGQCLKTTTVTVPKPIYACVKLEGIVIDKSKYSYKFVATSSSKNGAKLVTADFNFGDGKTTNNVKPDANGTTITTTHAYDTGGNYNAGATLHFNVSGRDVTAPTCKALVTPETVTPECKPGVPEGSPECTPCQYDSTLPSNSPKCTPPPPSELPNTGAGNVIAVFATVVVGGFLIYRQLLFRKHKAAFNAADNGVSPLPLADPLGTTKATLTGTPLAKRVSKSLRRNRPY